MGLVARLLTTMMWWLTSTSEIDLGPPDGNPTLTHERWGSLESVHLPPDLKSPFAPAAGPRTIVPVEGDPTRSALRIADIRDPFRDTALPLAKRTVRIARLPNDLQDPFHPPPRPCAKDVEIDGVPVEVQRPDALRATRATRCRAGQHRAGPSPDLRDPFARRRG